MPNFETPAAAARRSGAAAPGRARGRGGHRIARACRNAASGALAAAFALLLLAGAPPALAAATVEVTGFGSNPGNLRMFKHVPDGLPAASPLVVVLHGCTQNARGYGAGSGWVQLAEKLRVALVLPEQTQANNQNRCFNWFLRSDNRRDRGEALSIKQMVDRMKADHGVDAARIFVTGLSAGGAMASVMLATYPDVFAAGGIVAGLPYGCANDATPFQPIQALQCMGSGHPGGGGAHAGSPAGQPPASLPQQPPICVFFPALPVCSHGNGPISADEWGDFVRRASNHTGPFPRVSIWHGDADQTVNPVNADAAASQWTNVHGIGPAPSAQDTLKGHPRRLFKDAAGTVVVETVKVAGMPHGVPVDPGPGADQCGTAAAFILDVGICSSFFQARFWGLAN